jgi:uncharacterized protein HemX
MDAPTPQPIEKKEGGGVGPIAAIVIVVILVALGGVYFLFQENARLHKAPVQEQLNA